MSIPAAYLHHADVQAMNARLDEVVALGARWVRTDANWSWIEPRQGAPDWSELDALVSAADARGLDVLLVVGRMPEWARPAGTTELHGPSSAAERSLFADFTGRLATRYAAQVDAWEVWNEPNLDQFWAPSPDPANYAAVLRAAYPAIKSADPATPVLIGGSGGASSGDIDSVTWYRGVYANGAQPYFDAATMHPYQDWRAAASGHQNTGEMARVPAVRQIMTENGDGAKPMWGTEFGAPTSGSTATTEDGQRVVYTDGRDLWFSRESGVLFAYYGRDRAAYGASTSRSPYWGLMRSDGTLKPAYDALAAWIAAG
ncbi:cellulase family glycosylhydrolase [Geodermatophilus maliterrae]|uniref:Cellulase family glycosylhydrolase n=1 Tax=Geodermatophilus maliterrae TaxID=3162531 RepID=A0ABV3XJ86_9ACTN